MTEAAVGFGNLTDDPEVRYTETGIRIDIGGQTVHPDGFIAGPAGGCRGDDMAQGSRSGAPGRVVRAWRRVAVAGAVAVLAAVAALIAARRKRGATVALSGAGTGLGAAPGQIVWVSQDGGILAANLDGTSPHTIVTGQRGLAGLAATSSHIYWANDGGGADRAGTIWTANLDGSSPHAIVTGQTLPSGVAADASHIYWADEGNETAGNGTISEASPDGSSPHVMVTGQTTPSGVAVDASHLYWASTDDGTVNQASPDGSSPHAIVTGQNSPSWMAVTPAAPELSFSPAPYDYGSVPPDRQQGRRSR
jgi:hypothetical protein